MQFNPIRALFKYDGQVTLHVFHVINPKIEYATVTLNEKFKVKIEVIAHDHHPMMDALLVEVETVLQQYANRWKYFTIPFTPAQVMKNFLKSYRLLANPNR